MAQAPVRQIFQRLLKSHSETVLSEYTTTSTWLNICILQNTHDGVSLLKPLAVIVAMIGMRIASLD